MARQRMVDGGKGGIEKGVPDLEHLRDRGRIHEILAKQAGIGTVDIKVHHGLTEEEKLEFAHKNNVITREISREEKIAKAIELRKEGRSQRQISDWLGVSHMTVKRWCEEYSTVTNVTVEKIEGDDGKEYSSKQPSSAEVAKRREQVKELREKGVKPADIALADSARPQPIL
ncbi:MULTISPECIES: helix-turn-helix domain-containing protein [Bacillus]|uniref:helix-turn-helix domain-containing protein n=1 Tax=Bacillus TaxID=1386 RepID=UPI00030D611A|nr:MULTISPECIES: helix-turn-helix domain-containing protein [Bacillus]